MNSDMLTLGDGAAGLDHVARWWSNGHLQRVDRRDANSERLGGAAAPAATLSRRCAGIRPKYVSSLHVSLHRYTRKYMRGFSVLNSSKRVRDAA